MLDAKLFITFFKCYEDSYFMLSAGTAMLLLIMILCFVNDISFGFNLVF